MAADRWPKSLRTLRTRVCDPITFSVMSKIIQQKVTSLKKGIKLSSESELLREITGYFAVRQRSQTSGRTLSFSRGMYK